MKNSSDCGHAKNVANFRELISVLKSLGTAYNPGRADMVISALDKLNTDAETAISDYFDATVNYKNAVVDRENAYRELNIITGRMINTFHALESSRHILANARTMANKIQGRTYKKKTTNATTVINTATVNTDLTVDIENEPNTKTRHFVSEMTFDMRLSNFMLFTKYLGGSLSYKPNETELTIKALLTRADELRQINDAVDRQLAALNAARRKRDELLYHENSGLVDLAISIKLYNKALFGPNSQEYKKVCHIAFYRKYIN